MGDTFVLQVIKLQASIRYAEEDYPNARVSNYIGN